MSEVDFDKLPDMPLEQRLPLAIEACQTALQCENSPELREFARKIGKILEPKGLWFIEVKFDFTVQKPEQK